MKKPHRHLVDLSRKFSLLCNLFYPAPPCKILTGHYYVKLMDQGVKEAQLEQVRCPIGMAIEADTPEEIAVSIVGELIYQRATGRKAWHLA